MLMLTRRRGEAVDLRDTRSDEKICTLVVLGVDEGEVRLGFRAERHIQVLRDNAIKVNRGRNSAARHMRHSFEWTPSDGLFVHDAKTDTHLTIPAAQLPPMLMRLIAEQDDKLRQRQEVTS